MAGKEYYPDIALTGSFFKRPGEFQDMWSLTTTINVPLYYRTKQRQAAFEAESFLSEAVRELVATKLMLS
jgi:outer membrane protein TolC